MYKLLIVDDDPFILEGLQSILPWEEYGFEIAGLASDGEEAIQLLDQYDFHLIITDIRMPRKDGIALIKHARETRPGIMCIVLSAYADFDYIKVAVGYGIENYLIKPLNEEDLFSTIANVVKKLDQQMKSARIISDQTDVLQENVLYRFITDDIPEEEFVERTDMLGIHFTSECYVIAIVKPVHEIQSGSDAMPMLKQHCKTIMANLPLRSYVFPDYSGNMIILLLASDEDIGQNRLDQWLQSFNVDLRLHFPHPIVISVGNTVHHSSELHQSLINAYRLQPYQWLEPHLSVIRYEDWSQSTNPHLQKKMREFLLSRNKHEFLGFIESLASSEEFHNHFVEVFDAMMQEFKTIHPHLDPFLGDHLRTWSSHVHSSNGGQSFESIKLLAAHMIETLLTDDERISPVVKNVISHIHKSYASNMGLKELASKYRMNVNYLGQLFKKETGELFNDYLNQYRIHIAKELLLRTDLKTSEISNQTGFRNLNYFYMIFKKLTGLSPQEYRLNHR